MNKEKKYSEEEVVNMLGDYWDYLDYWYNSAIEDVMTTKEWFNERVKEVCVCKQPNPITKVSESGILTYCQQCAKTYKK